MNILDKRENETDLQYHKRLVYGKLVDKTLADVDYSEIAELIYGQAYSSDVARRMLYGSKRTLDMMDDETVKNVTDTSLLSEIETKKLELQVERQKFFDQRRERNKILADIGRKENLEDRIIECAEKMNEEFPLIQSDEQIYHTSFGNEAVLVLSDWHYGLKSSNVWGEYNTDICRQRIGNVAHEAIERMDINVCDKLHVVVLGDLIHGAIHTSARVESEELAVDQLMHVSEILAETIALLAEAVPEIVVYNTYGNHARIVANKKDNLHEDSLERVIGWWLRERFKNYEDITVVDDTGTEFVYFTPCGFGVVASHGDLDNVKTSPRLLSTMMQKRYGRDVDCVLLGDKHHQESFEELGISSYITPSLCSADDYANSKRLYSTPGQLMLIFKDGYGVDAVYNLRAD